MICGSLKTLVRDIDVNKISAMIPEDEESALIKHFPRIIRSLLFSFLSLLKIIHLNKKRQFSIIHAQDANYGAMAAIGAAKLIHVPVVLHVHGINMDVVRLLTRPKWLARLYRAYYLLLQKESIKRSNCVICVSKDNKKYLPIGKKIVIPMGVNTTSFQVAQNSADTYEELRIPKHAFTVGYVGVLSAGKGLGILLKSFYHVLQETPKNVLIYLVIVGDDPERRSLEDLANRLGIRQSLRFTGFRTDVARLLSVMDIFVFPSRSEGSPIAVLEAMAAGKAIVASDIPAIREILRHGEEAVLVDPYNMVELKQAILLLYNDQNLRVKLGRKAKEKAKLYDADRIYRRILEVYEELIHHKAK